MARFTIRYHLTLLATARSYVDESQYSIAVVTAQMAFEVRIEEVFDELYSRFEGLPAVELVAALPDRSMMQNAVRSLWHALTGDQISRAPSWKQYHQHIERRNRLVHGREAWGDYDQAVASIDAVEALIAHVDSVIDRVADARRES